MFFFFFYICLSFAEDSLRCQKATPISTSIFVECVITTVLFPSHNIFLTPHPQIYIQTRNPASLNMQIARNDYPDRPLTLEGALGKKKHYQQFQPVITLSKGYTIHWDQAAPAEVTIWLINFNKSVHSLNTHS